MVAVVSTTSLNYFRAIHEIMKYRDQDHLILPILNASSGLDLIQAAKLILVLHPDTLFGMFAKTFNRTLNKMEHHVTDFDSRVITNLNDYLPEFNDNPYLTPELDNQLNQAFNRSILKVVEVLETKTDGPLFVKQDCIFNKLYNQGEFDDPIFSAFGGVTKSVKDGDKLYILSTVELAKALCDPVPYNPATGESFSYSETIALKQNMNLQLALTKYTT